MSSATDGTKESILSLNAEACWFMCMDHFQEAGEQLTAALERLGKLHESMRDQGTRQIFCRRPVNNLSLKPIRLQPTMYDDTAFQPYNWAFLVIDGCGGDSDECINPDNCSVVASILLYNMALCFQITGNAEAETNPSRLLKALEVYDMALSLLDQCILSNRLLRLATVNNKGYLLTLLNENLDAQRCLRALKYMLLAADEPVEIQREDILGIHMNVALVYKRFTHAAAA